MALRIPRLRINRLWFVLGGAIVMGLLAAWLSVGYLKNKEKAIAVELAEKAKGGPTVSVVVPTQDAAKGAVVGGGLMAARDVPADLLYEDVVTADAFKDVEGKRLLKPVLKGRPLRRSDVIDDRPKDLSSEVEPGRRALTFDIDETNSFSQMLRAGNFVDLYLIAQNPTAQAAVGQEIRPLLSKVKVLATGQQLRAAENIEQVPGQPTRVISYSNITVDVTSEDAARIALATQVGKIRAVLRNHGDEGLKAAALLNTADLFVAKKGDKQGKAVDYIVGGTGAGSGATAPMAINLPNINIPGLSAAATGNGQASPLSGMPPSISNNVPVAPTATAVR
jgi:pilus assembly protein CpaB